MEIGDFVEKAKDALDDHPDEAGKLLDNATSALKERTPDAVDAQIDNAVDKAQEYLRKE